MSVETMRDRFYSTVGSLLDTDDRTAVVIAEIGGRQLAAVARRFPGRVINVGIREQLMVSVAAGLAHVGLRPIIHSYAPFAVERPFEQLKLDLSHQGLGAVVVSVGASYDWAAGGRTHQAPEDVALLDTLPGWEVHVPGHAEEVERVLRAAAKQSGPVYIRLSEQENRQVHFAPILRRGSRGTVIAVGPMLDRVLAATSELDVTVLYLVTVRPLDADLIRRTLGTPAVVLVEPYLEGTSAGAVSTAVADVPHRLLSIGVPRVEHRHYGTAADHDIAHGLDARALRHRIAAFIGASPVQPEPGSAVSGQEILAHSAPAALD